jgi:hypothetical protein
MTTRPQRVLAIVGVVVVLVAVLTVVLVADRSAKRYDPNTPEGTVQAYVAAVLDGDRERAGALLAADGPCDASNLDLTYPPSYDRVVLVHSQADGDTARVEVDAVNSEGPFGAFGYRERIAFELERSGTGWSITGQPWPMYECFKGK